MLIEFRVENHRSIRDEQVLSMEAATDKGDKDDVRPRTVKGYKKKLLPVACIYGANASGKSNVLSALSWMRDAVRSSSAIWDPEQGVPRDQFAWGEKRELPSMYEVTVLRSGIRYEYGFVANDKAFLEEWLYAWPRGKKQVWYERDEQKLRFGDALKESNKAIAASMRENSLFLSTAIQLNIQELRPAYSWFSQLVSMPNTGAPNAMFEMSSGTQLSMLLETMRPETEHPIELHANSVVNSFTNILQRADIGILDFKVDRSEPEKPTKLRRTRFLLRHENSHDEEAWLPLYQESKGTQTLFRMGLPILNALGRGALFLADELEASLHPTLARHIVDLFNDPLTNPNNAQLLFTTHDTNLLGNTLGEPELRRDEVWLTEKDKDGATVLYPLTDYKPRAGENLERGYLQGRYGAIPFLGNFSLAGE